MWRMPEALAMLAQQRWQHLSIWRIALGNDLPIADQAVFDFGIIDLVPELGFMRGGFAPSDDLGMRLPQAGDFFLGGNGFALQHPTGRLIDHAFDQWPQFLELHNQSGRNRVVFLLAQYLVGLAGLVQGRVGNLDQFAVLLGDRSLSDLLLALPLGGGTTPLADLSTAD